MTKQSKNKSVLNSKQYALLKEVCRFRFVTAELLTHHFHLASVSALRRRLQRLVDAGYLGRHFESTNHLLRLPATYYVTPKGRLPLSDEIPVTVLNGIYKHKDASQRLQDHCVTVMKVMVQLEQRLGARVACYPKNDLTLYDYLPQPLPDGLIITSDEEGQRTYYLLEVFDSSTPRFVMRNRLRYYRDYFESGEWSATKLELPVVAVVCRSELQKQFVQATLDNPALGIASDVQFDVSVVD